MTESIVHADTCRKRIDGFEYECTCQTKEKRYEYMFNKLWNKLRDNWACPDAFLVECNDGPWERCPHKHISKPGHENYEEKCWRQFRKDLMK